MKQPACFRAQWCTCGHRWHEHRRGGGACRQQSSYDTPCQCPSHEPSQDDCLYVECPEHGRRTCCGTAPGGPHVGCILR